jgi:serine-type D-Ala-D-Ala carboxypeptidase (penicillin-binding protein 5/6)
MIGRRTRRVLALTVVALCAPLSHARGQVDFAVTAKSAVLLDADSAQVLFDQNGTSRISPASLAKLMTVYIAYDALRNGAVRLEDPVAISQLAAKMGGSQIFLQRGDRVSFGNLLRGVAVASGNDATVALAEHVAGFSEAFVGQMNTKAAALGLLDTHFRNPHGLGAENQYSTARDLGFLAHHLIHDHPAVVPLHATKEFEYNGIKQQNRNRLLWKDPRVDGLKTGWLQEAGYHIVATAKEGERRLIVVILGARHERSREEIALRLVNYGFKQFHNVHFFNKGDRVKNLPVWKGTEGHLGVIAAGPGVVTVKNGTSQPALAYQLPAKLVAPIGVGQKVGEAVISAEGRELARIELVAVEAVPAAGLLKRFLHSIALLFF